MSEEELLFHSRKLSTWQNYLKHREYFTLLLPLLIYYIVFHYMPIYGIVMAFKNFSPVRGISESPWVGLKYFKAIFSSIYFGRVFANTLLISFYKLFWGFPAPILLAIMFNELKGQKFKRIIQTITYLPHFISWVVLASIMIEILSPSRGMVNLVIKSLGFEPIFFTADPDWFRSVLVGSSIWKEVGWKSIVFLAAISGIDPQIYEAAEVDGATRFQKIFRITLPCLAPVITIMFIFATGKIINDDFSQIMNFLNPMVLSVGDVLETYTYREGLEKMNYSYATAVGLFKNGASFLLVMLSNTVARKMSNNSVW